MTRGDDEWILLFVFFFSFSFFRFHFFLQFFVLFLGLMDLWLGRAMESYDWPEYNRLTRTISWTIENSSLRKGAADEIGVGWGDDDELCGVDTG